MANSPSALFADCVDAASLLTDSQAIAPYAQEMRGIVSGNTACVVLPRDVSQVQAIMRRAQETSTKLVVHGGNTGLVGGGVPFGGVVMSLKRLNRIRAVDPVNATLTAEAGVILKDVQDAAEAADRLFPLSLASEGSCTIGGNIATNAGGTAVLRYGNMRDLVLGLEVVLPDGQLWNGLTGLRKDNAGYDLKHLFIGSEGTLGVVTAAVVKLFPKPRARVTAFAGAASEEAVVRLFDRMRGEAGEQLTTFEILPRFGIEIVLKHAPSVRDPLSAPYPFYAMIELTTPERDAPLAEKLETILGQALEADEILDATIASSEAQSNDFWRIREQLSETQRYEGGSIKHDISVPISAISEFMVTTSRLCEAEMPGVRACAFGHIGDGNLHFNLSQPVGMDKAAFLGSWHRFNAIVHDEVAKRGGSIAAEHGVGLFKRDELAHYKDPVQLALMSTIKRALDPANLLNPGKIVRIGDDLPIFEPKDQRGT